MRIFRRADYIEMPWKNGGGSTTQLAIAPPAAGLDDFDWRISSARVADAGAFSRFPGVDRSLLILEGGGLLLQQEGRTITLTARSEAHVFAGEDEIVAALSDGPVTDFNVMTRRARWRHALQAVQLRGVLSCARDAELMFVYCASGSPLTVRCAQGAEALCAVGEAVLIDNGDGDQVELAAADARLCIARLIFKETPDVE
jgi:hypothetical protein